MVLQTDARRQIGTIGDLMPVLVKVFGLQHVTHDYRTIFCNLPGIYNNIPAVSWSCNGNAYVQNGGPRSLFLSPKSNYTKPRAPNANSLDGFMPPFLP